MSARIEDFVEYYKNMDQVKDIDPAIWMMKYLINRLELNESQILWLCFLYSITYHLPAAYLIINEYPDLELVGEKRIRKWWNEIQHKVPFQRDKLKQRKYLPESILSYKKLVNGNQKKYFDSILQGHSPQENFNLLWNDLYKNIEHFGRFSVWNWAQTLKEVAGYDIEPSDLMLGKNNSESHTHGLCYAFGKDEWAKKERYKDKNGKRKKKVYKFSTQDILYLDTNVETLVEKLKDVSDDVNYFRIETVACAYKKLFRERDSRYVGYYLDRQAEDIHSIEFNNFYGVDWQILWDARNECLEKYVNNYLVDKTKFKWKYEEKLKLPKKKAKDMNYSIKEVDLKLLRDKFYEEKSKNSSFFIFRMEQQGIDKTYGLFLDDELIGYIGIKKNKKEPVLNLSYLYISVNYRKQGFGTLLTKYFLEDILDKDEFRGFYVRISADKDAVKMYENFGIKFACKQKSGTFLTLFKRENGEFVFPCDDYTKKKFKAKRGGCVEYLEELGFQEKCKEDLEIW